MREIVLDTETTGLDPKTGHKIVEIGCIELVNRIKTGREFHYYINPERDMPKEAFMIHGISLDMLIDKPLFSHIAEEFLEFLQDDRLIIHNAGFDIKFLNHEFKIVDKPKLCFSRVLDTLELARRKFPGSPASLNALCKKLNISLDTRDKHGALIDAHLLADVYIKLTGGEQSSLGFENNNSDKVFDFSQKTKKFYPKREFLPTKEELEAHKKFLEKIKNPIWEN